MSNIEEDIKKLNKYIELIIDKDYCDCNELNVIIGKHCDGSKNVAYAIKNTLAEREEDKKRMAELKKENEELKSDNLEKGRILEVFDNRKYRKKYLEERRKEEPNLLYPDGDEIYKRYYEQKKQIDLITNYLAEQDLGHYIKEDGGEIMGLFRCYNKDDWKQHFEEQAKKEGE